MILIDDREPEEFWPLGNKVRHLNYGDFKLYHKYRFHKDEEPLIRSYRIERKTPTGFLQDHHSGRLHYQLEHCQALILDLRKWGFNIEKYLTWHTTITPDDFWNEVNGVALHHTVLNFTSLEQLRGMLERYDVKNTKGVLAHYRVPIIKQGYDESVDILGRFGGVGIKRATDLLKTYGTLNEVFNAAEEQRYIDGVGPVTMQKIVNRLNTKFDGQ